MSDLRVSALDHTVLVRAADPLAAVIREALAPIEEQTGTVPASKIELRSVGDGRWIMDVDGAGSRPMSAGRVVAHLLEHLNGRAADSLLDEIPLHAAAVVHPGGGVIALAGSSGSGKSTLGAAAVRSGWGFVAEEVAAVRVEDRTVRPYHRPIGLRAGGAAAIGVSIPADDWFDEVYPWPVTAASRRTGGSLLGIALVRRNDTDSDGATDGEAHLEEVRPARALVELVEHTVVPSDDRIVPVFRRLDELVREVPVVRVSVGTPEAAVALLDGLGTSWRT